MESAEHTERFDYVDFLICENDGIGPSQGSDTLSSVRPLRTRRINELRNQYKRHRLWRKYGYRGRHIRKVVKADITDVGHEEHTNM